MKKINNHSINKIMKPILPDIIRRDRLYEILDACQECSITWVAGAAGSGKSTLIADYLQKRNEPHIWYRLDDGDNDLSSFYYYMAEALKTANPRKKNAPIPFLTTEYKTRAVEFSRRFFEYIAQSLKAPFVVVFDNYREKSFDSIFHASFKEGLLHLIPAVQVILISREAPLNGFSDLVAGKCLRVIGNQDLAFSEQETEAFIQKEIGKNLSKEISRQIFEATKGWAAGLRLILTGIINNKTMPDSMREITLDNIFDYFDSELFHLLSPKIRAMLVKSALWPRMPLTILKSFMKHIDVGSLLNQLAESHFFIERYGEAADTIYQYHPLFHEFLKSRVAEYLDQREIQIIQIQTASAFEKFGWLEESLELFLQAGSYDDYARIILKNARPMIQHIRYKTLRKWLLSLPENVRTSNAWLNYWTGISYRFGSLTESRKYCLVAYEQFKKTDDLNGTLLAWSVIVDSITYEFNRLSELDPYIAWFKSHIKKSFRFDSMETEARVSGSILCALFCREPENRDIDFWRRRALASAAFCDDITVKISTHVWSIVSSLFTCPNEQTQFMQNHLMRLTENHGSRLVHLAYLWIKAYSFFMADVSAAEMIETASKGLQLAEEIQVHLYDGTFYVTGIIASLAMLDFQASDQFLKQFKSSLKPNELYFNALYHYLKCIHHFNACEYELAADHGKTAVDLMHKTGLVLLKYSAILHMLQVRFQMNPSKKIIEEVDNVIHLGMERKSTVIVYHGRLTKSYMLLCLGRESEGLEHLKETFALGRKHGFIRWVWSWPRPIIEKLCIAASEHNLELDFTRRLIRSFRLYPAAPEDVFENWNWPVQIETLGRFQVFIEGRKKNSCAKTKAKPWELLQLLIAFGPKPVAIDKIMDYLWPEKDGDLAHNTFKTTLNRLRNLLGAKEIILLNDNKIAINHKICLIDLDLFERMIQRAQQANGLDRYDWLEKALALYQGSFLSGEPWKMWAVTKREELKEKYISAMIELGTWFEKSDKTDQAIACYQQGLRHEPTEEILYQRLMEIYIKRGQKTETFKHYQSRFPEIQEEEEAQSSSTTQTIFSRFD
jgi:DNA-binding SARP family transcriptional activator